MNKTFTPNQTSNFHLGSTGLSNSVGIETMQKEAKQVMEPNELVVRNILNYARSLEVFKPKNNLVFYFVKN
jgi:hypothetical protein